MFRNLVSAGDESLTGCKSLHPLVSLQLLSQALAVAALGLDS